MDWTARQEAYLRADVPCHILSYLVIFIGQRLRNAGAIGSIGHTLPQLPLRFPGVRCFQGLQAKWQARMTCTRQKHLKAQPSGLPQPRICKKKLLYFL